MREYITKKSWKVDDTEGLKQCSLCKKDVILAAKYIKGTANKINFFVFCPECKSKTRLRKDITGAKDEWNEFEGSLNTVQCLNMCKKITFTKKEKKELKLYNVKYKTWNMFFSDLNDNAMLSVGYNKADAISKVKNVVESDARDFEAELIHSVFGHEIVIKTNDE